MKLIFIGSGSAFTVGADNYQSNMILEDDSGKKLLVDCGSDARFALHELGLSYKDIEAVYISHLHADHTGGLEWLALTTKFDPICKKPILFVSKNIVYNLWNTVLSGGLQTLENEVADLSSYFLVKPIDDSNFFIWSDVKFRLVQTVHVFSANAIVLSYGLLFTVNEKTILITTDTKAVIPSQINDCYQIADIIFHDCETSSKHSRVHSHFDELKNLDANIKKKMWLYHYNPGPLPNAQKEGFRGFVKKGQCFDFSDESTL